MLLRIIVAMLTFCFVGMAQPGTQTPTTGTKSAPEKKEGPKIADELRARFWRAQSDSLAASAQFQKARAAMDSIIAEMKAVCGNTDFEINADEKGEPNCQEVKKPVADRKLGPPTENTPPAPAPPAATPK